MPDELAKHWGRNIAARREELGLSKTDLAVRAEVSESAITRWEAGEREPRHPYRRALAAALETTVAELFPWPDEAVVA